MEDKHKLIGGGLTGIVLLLIWNFLFDGSLTSGITILIILLVAILIILLEMLFLILQSTLVTNFFGKSILAIFCASLVAIVILTILLGMQWIPTVFAAMYILLGSLIVAVMGLYLNNKLAVEQEKRQIKRIIIALRLTVNDNKKTAEGYLVDIKVNSLKNLKPLKTSFWETFAQNIITADLDPELLEDLMSIRELTLKINHKLSERNIVTAQEDIEPDQPPKKLMNIDDSLKEKLESFIRDSDEYLRNIDKI